MFPDPLTDEELAVLERELHPVNGVDPLLCGEDARRLIATVKVLQLEVRSLRNSTSKR